MNESLIKLEQFIANQQPLAIALSGGVDSLTLAWTAHKVKPSTVMVHAVSPAVPPEATELVKHYARKASWTLKIIDAQEYSDSRYRENPVNRCYFCKTNLYARIKEATGLTIASGTNTDDLGDYRPGLTAASQHNVIHPYVEVGIDKTTVRSIATLHELHDVAVLPAQPCLASRVETGISIEANDLVFINTMESKLRSQLGNGDIRCRITAAGIKLEIEEKLLTTITTRETEKLKTKVEQNAKQLCAEHSRTYVGLAPYSKGSAFIHPVTIKHV